MTITPDPHATRRVLLYSGGVDSYCAAILTDPDVLLHVPLGGAYGDVETDRLRTPPGMEHRLVIAPLAGISRFESPKLNFILPARNAFLALMGAQYGSEVMLGSIAANTGSDKDEGFADLMTQLMSHIWSEQPLWNPVARPTRLTLPVRHLTKAQLVAEALRAGATPEDIRDRTFSCYSPHDDGTPCGYCAPCGKKWAALAANDVEPGVDARHAYRPYWEEYVKAEGTVPPGRTEQHMKDVKAAWHSRW